MVDPHEAASAAWADMRASGALIVDRWYRGDGIRTGLDCFLADMGSPPSPQHTLALADDFAPYGPDNCFWQRPRGRVETGDRGDGHARTRGGKADSSAPTCSSRGA